MREPHVALISLPFLAALEIACSSVKVLDLSRTTPEEILQRVRLNQGVVSTLQASGAISIESAEFSGTGSISVSLKRPDSLLIKIEGPFGLDIGSMLLTEERFIYYDSYSNRVVTGATTKKNIRNLLRVDLSFSDVMDLISGTTSLTRQVVPPDSIAVDGGDLVLYFHNASSTERYRVDAERSVVTRYEVFGDDEPILLTRFAKFSRIENTMLPHSIRVLTRKQGLSLHYDEITINKPRLDLFISIPENARRIYW